MIRVLSCVAVVLATPVMSDIAPIAPLATPVQVAELAEPYVGDSPLAGPQVDCVCDDIWAKPIQAYMLELEYSMQGHALMGPMS